MEADSPMQLSRCAWRSCSIASRRKVARNMPTGFGECPLSGKPDVKADIRKCPLLTRKRHQLRDFGAMQHGM